MDNTDGNTTPILPRITLPDPDYTEVEEAQEAGIVADEVIQTLDLETTSNALEEVNRILVSEDNEAPGFPQLSKNERESNNEEHNITSDAFPSECSLDVLDKDSDSNASPMEIYPSEEIKDDTLGVAINSLKAEYFNVIEGEPVKEGERCPVYSEIQSLNTVDSISNGNIAESREENQEGKTGIVIQDANLGPIAITSDIEMATEQLDVPLFWPYKISDEFLKQEEMKCIATSAKNEFNGRNLKGCKWAPDGSCLLSNSDDNILRLYNLPTSVYQVDDWKNSKLLEEDTTWAPAIVMREGGQIYDYSWFPLMNSSDAVSACFLSTAADGPIHLRDGFTGGLRASYLAYNQFDEVTTAYSVAFDPYGEKIYSGFNQTVRIFNTSRPGRDCTVRELKHKLLSDLNQKGIISCIAVNPTLNGVYACGSYRRTVGLYLEDGSVLCILEGHLGGVTHLTFSHDGSKLFTGGRKDSRLICWDMRQMGEEYKILDRVVETNQRIYFDVSRNDQYLVSGGSDGCIRLWDLHSSDEKSTNIKTSTDCVNGVSLNPFVPILATASGQRHFPDISESGDSDSDNMFADSASKVREAKEIKLWKFE